MKTTFSLEENHKLLLRAALYNDERAVEAYQLWKSRIDINKLNHGEIGLLPLLHHNLRKFNISDSLTEKMKGVARRTWLFNQQLLHIARGLFKELNKSNIPCCLLKGAAMGVHVYKNLALRTMQDIDLLVPKNHAKDVIDIIESQGFESMIPEVDKNHHFDFRHSLGFRNKDGFIMDLHCYILEECYVDGESHPFHYQTIKTEYKDIPITVPEPTELLFHTIIHGMRWHPTSPIRWISDAHAILESCDIEWTRLISYAKKYQLVLPIKSALNLVKTEFDMNIPDNILQDLENCAVTQVDKAGFEFHLSPYNSFIPSFLRHWNHYQRSAGDHQRIGFLQFCRRYWGVRNFRDLIKAAFKKTCKKIYSS